MRTAGILIILALVLAACGDDATTPAPATDAPDGPTPLPATWTPSPEGFEPSATPAGEALDVDDAPVESGPPGGGSTLPPTWTPFVRPTITPLPRPIVTLEPLTPTPIEEGAPSPTPLGEHCFTLESLVEEDPRIEVGQGVGIRWTPVEGISAYRVEVAHPDGGMILNAITPDTLYEIPGTTFTTAGVYGWQVTPLAGDQPVCYSISGEIITSFPRE